MYGIASLLPQPYYQQVEDLWDCLERSFGFTSVRITPFPHITWAVGEEEPPGLQQHLAELTASTPPLPLQTTGIGFFPGPEPVVYIHVEKTPPLMAFHAEICQMLTDLGAAPARWYTPENWVPHITLIIQDLSENKLSIVLGMLQQLPLSWEMTLAGLNLGRAEANDVFHLIQDFPFAGELNHEPHEPEQKPKSK